MKVIIEDCFGEEKGRGYRPELPEPFAYYKVLELSQEEFKNLLLELNKEPRHRSVLGSPFIDYAREADIIAITIYNYYQE